MKTGGEAVKLNSSCHLRYAHALFGVKDRDLGILEANFAPNICDFLDFVRPGGKRLPRQTLDDHGCYLPIFASFLSLRLGRSQGSL